MSPDILVLDEPSANLDPASRRTLISLLRQFTHTKSLLPMIWTWSWICARAAS